MRLFRGILVQLMAVLGLKQKEGRKEDALTTRNDQKYLDLTEILCPIISYKKE